MSAEFKKKFKGKKKEEEKRREEKDKQKDEKGKGKENEKAKGKGGESPQAWKSYSPRLGSNIRRSNGDGSKEKDGMKKDPSRPVGILESLRFQFSRRSRENTMEEIPPRPQLASSPPRIMHTQQDHDEIVPAAPHPPLQEAIPFDNCSYQQKLRSNYDLLDEYIKKATEDRKRQSEDKRYAKTQRSIAFKPSELLPSPSLEKIEYSFFGDPSPTSDNIQVSPIKHAIDRMTKHYTSFDNLHPSNPNPTNSPMEINHSQQCNVSPSSVPHYVNRTQNDSMPHSNAQMQAQFHSAIVTASLGSPTVPRKKTPPEPPSQLDAFATKYLALSQEVQFNKQHIHPGDTSIHRTNISISPFASTTNTATAAMSQGEGVNNERFSNTQQPFQPHPFHSTEPPAGISISNPFQEVATATTNTDVPFQRQPANPFFTLSKSTGRNSAPILLDNLSNIDCNSEKLESNIPNPKTEDCDDSIQSFEMDISDSGSRGSSCNRHKLQRWQTRYRRKSSRLGGIASKLREKPPPKSSKKLRILVILGAGINILRDNPKFAPQLAAASSRTEFERKLHEYAGLLNLEIAILTTNSESQIIDRLCDSHEHSGVDGCIINPAAFMQGYKALMASLKLVCFPVVEVHEFNSSAHGIISEISAFCLATLSLNVLFLYFATSSLINAYISGCGTFGYYLAFQALYEFINQ